MQALTSSTLLLAALPLAWLLPNHYPPWLSAWQEGLALCTVFAAALAARRVGSVARAWLLAAGLAAASVVLQWMAGRLYFGGDALMVLLYLAAFVLALALGTTLIEEPGQAPTSALEAVALGTVLAALVSVGMALAQWTGAVSLGIFGADLPPGARPFANVAQPNHLCTLVFLGLCSLALLHQCRRIGWIGFWTGTAFLVLGMVMTGSRTGWLQVAALVLLVLTRQARTGARLRGMHMAILVAVYAAATLLWPVLNEASQLSAGRPVTQQIQGGVRGTLWWAMLDAVAREPWWGYGWQQMALAQQAVALDHPPIQRHFEHSHNLILDLLLWAGIPTGAAVVALACAALTGLLRRLHDPRALWLLAGVIGVLAHAMVEFPLEYAYFLLPVGLALGAAHALEEHRPLQRFPAAALRLAGLTGGLLLGALAFEYLQAEQNTRMLRLESAHIGTSRVETEVPELRLLTQLSAFLRFARDEARPGMGEAEVEQARHVSERYAQPPAMFRYALIAGLNGDPEGARRTLGRLCRIHAPERCEEARTGWHLLQQRYPVLLQVAPP